MKFWSHILSRTLSGDMDIALPMQLPTLTVFCEKKKLDVYPSPDVAGPQRYRTRLGPTKETHSKNFNKAKVNLRAKKDLFFMDYLSAGKRIPAYSICAGPNTVMQPHSRQNYPLLRLFWWFITCFRVILDFLNC